MEPLDELSDVKERLQIALQQFSSEHQLSDWERGQRDGLYWAMQIVDEMLEFKVEKNPPSD